MFRYLTLATLLLTLSCCKKEPVEPRKEHYNVHLWVEPQQKTVDWAAIVLIKDTTVYAEDTVMQWKWKDQWTEKDFDTTITLKAGARGYFYIHWAGVGLQPTLYMEYDGTKKSELWDGQFDFELPK